MNGDESDSSGSGFELTRIDLGDDLVEKTATLPGRRSASENPSEGSSETPATPEDQIESARILRREGFPEEAKKVLRKILLSVPRHLEARQLLDEIHEAELKEMFGTAEATVRRSFFSSYDESILDVDSEEVVRLLDRDVGLSLKGPAKELSFFSDPKLLEEFARKIDRQLGDSARDRIDLAVGFIEMGIYSVAIRILQPLSSSSVELDRLSAATLAAYAHLMNDEPYRAISTLQPLLIDSDVETPKKTECFYLMGRAHQAIGSCAEAIGWYRQAQESETSYRDSSERIERCRTALSKKR